MNMTIEGKIGIEVTRLARGLRKSLPGLACLAVSVAAAAQTYIEFNAPVASTTVATQGTFPLSIRRGDRRTFP